MEYILDENWNSKELNVRSGKYEVTSLESSAGLLWLGMDNKLLAISNL